MYLNVFFYLLCRLLHYFTLFGVARLNNIFTNYSGIDGSVRNFIASCASKWYERCLLDQFHRVHRGCYICLNYTFSFETRAEKYCKYNENDNPRSKTKPMCRLNMFAIIMWNWLVLRNQIQMLPWILVVLLCWHTFMYSPLPINERDYLMFSWSLH